LRTTLSGLGSQLGWTLTIGAWENQMEALRRYTQDPDVREILIGSAGILIFAIFLVCVVQ
jgi:hypothetical protein